MERVRKTDYMMLKRLSVYIDTSESSVSTAYSTPKVSARINKHKRSFTVEFRKMKPYSILDRNPTKDMEPDFNVTRGRRKSTELASSRRRLSMGDRPIKANNTFDKSPLRYFKLLESFEEESLNKLTEFNFIPILK